MCRTVEQVPNQNPLPVPHHQRQYHRWNRCYVRSDHGAFWSCVPSLQRLILLHLDPLFAVSKVVRMCHYMQVLMRVSECMKVSCTKFLS